MKITVITPMREEQEKITNAFNEFSSLQHSYEVIISGIGRENVAKALINKPKSDLDILVGFTALPELKKPCPTN